MNMALVVARAGCGERGNSVSRDIDFVYQASDAHQWNRL